MSQFNFSLVFKGYHLNGRLSVQEKLFLNALVIKKSFTIYTSLLDNFWTRIMKPDLKTFKLKTAKPQAYE